MRTVLRKITANPVFDNIFSPFHISFLPLNHPQVVQYSINRKYRLQNQLAILHNILSINLFKNSRKTILYDLIFYIRSDRLVGLCPTPYLNFSSQVLPRRYSYFSMSAHLRPLTVWLHALVK